MRLAPMYLGNPSHINDPVEVKFPVAARRRVTGKPAACHFAFPFDRQHHATQESRRHLLRTPGDHSVRSGLPPGVARSEVTSGLRVLLDIERAFQKAANSRPRMLVAIGDAAGRTDDLIETEQPTRAFGHRQTGDHPRHPQARQNALSFEECGRSARQRQLPAPYLGPFAGRRHRQRLAAIAGLFGVHRLAVDLDPAMPDIEQTMRRCQRRRAGASRADLIVIKVQ